MSSTWCCAAARRRRSRAGIRGRPMTAKFVATPSQTVGPFFALGLDRPAWADLTRADPKGERITIEGQVLDGDGAPVPDAMIELWQANAAGRYDHVEDTQTDKHLDPNFHRSEE